MLKVIYVDKGLRNSSINVEQKQFDTGKRCSGQCGFKHCPLDSLFEDE